MNVLVKRRKTVQQFYVWWKTAGLERTLTFYYVAHSETPIPEPLSSYLHLELSASHHPAFLKSKENAPPLVWPDPRF